MHMSLSCHDIVFVEISMSMYFMVITAPRLWVFDVYVFIP